MVDLLSVPGLCMWYFVVTPLLQNLRTVWPSVHSALCGLVSRRPGASDLDLWPVDLEISPRSQSHKEMWL